MSEQLPPLDVDDGADLASLVDEVVKTRKVRPLRRDGQNVALLSPAPGQRRTRKGQPTSASDPLWNIVGMARSDGPGDVAANHDRYLAEAYLDRHE